MQRNTQNKHLKRAEFGQGKRWCKKVNDDIWIYIDLLVGLKAIYVERIIQSHIHTSGGNEKVKYMSNTTKYLHLLLCWKSAYLYFC